MAGEKVLVIDDSAETHRVMEELVLGPHGYSFLGARDGEEGLCKALVEKPDLIIMDLRMPKMNGLEVLTALHEEQCHIPVILTASHSSETVVIKAFRLGAKDYVIKPFKVEEMLEAIDRALAEKGRMGQLERKVKALDILYGVRKSVTSLLDLEEVLNRIVEAAVFVTGADEGSLMLVDKDTGELYLRAARGLGEEFARGFTLKVEDSIAGKVVKTGEPILESTQDEETLKVKTGYVVQSLLNVPLKAKEEVIGVLGVDNKESSVPFTEDDVRLLSTLADYATIAIMSAQLHEKTKHWSMKQEQRVNERTQELQMAYEEVKSLAAEREQKVKELDTLYNIGKSVTSLLDLEKVLNRIVEAAVFVTGADEGSLMLVDKDTGELYLRAARGLGEEFARGFTLKVEDSIAGKVVKTGEPILESTQDEEAIKVKTGYFVQSLLNVPLKAKGEVIGVLGVDNKLRSMPFTDNDVNLLSALADYAAIAIENARLYQESHEETERLTELLHAVVEERTQELRTAYKELQEAQEQMLAAERWAILGKAAANLAHRINNTAGLIPVVAQDLEELLADVALEEERRQEVDADLQRIERNTRFTLQMADALFKPFEELPTEDCDVNALLEESISVADVPKDVALKTKYADELPRVSASRRLADVFVELITNAVKVMPGGGQLEIGSRLGGEGWVEVWFSDTGHGIPHESQDKIFDLFFTTSEDSLGFGLWWVKTFLEQQGATIDVESELDKGTTFTVRLPIEGPRAAVE